MAKGHGRYMVLLGVLIAIAAGLFAHNLCTGNCSAGTVQTITIPEGATKMMNTGQKVPGIPDQIVGRVGDTLVIDNRDSATQFVAGYAISPRQVLNIPLNREGEYETNCSVHRKRSLKMVISP